MFIETSTKQEDKATNATKNHHRQIAICRIEVVAISPLTVNKRNEIQRTISKSQNDKQSIESAETGITGSKSLSLRVHTRGEDVGPLEANCKVSCNR